MPNRETTTTPPAETYSVRNFETAGIPFRKAVNVVAVGGDPTGESSITPVLEEVLSSRTLAVFPEGTYRIDTPIRIPDHRIGLIGAGDVTFRPSKEITKKFLIAEGTDVFLFKGIDVDVREASNTGIQLHCPTKFHVEDVEYVGRGGPTGQAFNLAVTKSRGTGRLRNVQVPKGGFPDMYYGPHGERGNGRIGIWTGILHHGTLRVENSEISEFGNNGMYTSRTPGKVQVVDSHFENNNVSSIRINGKGSYVDRCTVVVDYRLYDGPTLMHTDRAFNPRGIMIDGAVGRKGVPPQEPGVEVRNSRVAIKHTPPGTSVQSAIEQNPAARTLSVKNTVIEVLVDDTPAVRRPFPGTGEGWRPWQKKPPEPYWTKLEDVNILGQSTTGNNVELFGAHDSILRNCHIDTPGANRAGVYLRDSTGVVIDGGQIRTGGFPLIVTDTKGFSRDGCRLLMSEPPQLNMLSTPGTMTKYATVRPPSSTEGPTCVVGNRDGAQTDNSWTLKLATIENGALLGVTE